MFKKLIVCIFGATLWGSGAYAQERPVVRYQLYGKIIGHMPEWVMAEKKLCEKYGITCESVTLNSAPLAQAASAAGSVDIINSTLDTSLVAVERGNDLVFVGATTSVVPYVMLVRPDVQLPNKAAGYPKVMSDLKGMKIGVTSRGSSAEVFLRSLLTGAGMSIESVTVVPVGPPVTAIAALAAKQVDAALSWDPGPALCSATGACSVVIDLRYGDGPSDIRAIKGGTLLQTQRQYAQKYPERVDAFNKARAEAIHWLQDPKNHDELMKIVKKNMVLGDNIKDHDKAYELMVKEQLPQYTTTFSVDTVKSWYTYLLTNRFLEGKIDINSLIYKNAPLTSAAK